MIAKCRKCGDDAEHSTRPSGKPTAYCKECQRIYSREHYATHGHKANIRRYVHHKASRRARRLLLRQLKSGPCVECGGTFHTAAMDFDHVRGEKLFEIGSPVGLGVSRARLDDEIAKCDLVCANCHRVRTFNRRHSGEVGKRPATPFGAEASSGFDSHLPHQ